MQSGLSGIPKREASESRNMSRRRCIDRQGKTAVSCLWHGQDCCVPSQVRRKHRITARPRSSARSAHRKARPHLEFVFGSALPSFSQNTRKLD
jgi:hypothetical protein